MREETTTASSSDHRAQRCSDGKMVDGVGICKLNIQGMWVGTQARNMAEEFG